MNEEIKITIPNLAEMVNASMVKQFSEENLQGILDKLMHKVMEESIDQLFSYRGPIKEQIKEHIKNTVGIDTSKIPLINYTELLAIAAQRSVLKLESDSLKKHAEKTFEDLIKAPPKCCSLSEIVKMYHHAIGTELHYEIVEENVCDDSGDYALDLEYINELSYPDSRSLSSYRNIVFRVPELKEAPDLVLDIRMSDDSKSFELRGFAYAKGKRPQVIHKLDLFEWDKLSEFEQELYLLQQHEIKIVFDEADLTETLVFKKE